MMKATETSVHEPLVYTPASLLKRLNTPVKVLSRSSLYEALRRGEIKALRVGTRKLLIPAASVREWLEGNGLERAK